MMGKMANHTDFFRFFRMNWRSILLTVTMFLLAGSTCGCIPFLWAARYQAEIDARQADKPQIHYSSTVDDAKKTHPLRHDTKVVVVKYHDWLEGLEAKYEFLDTRTISPSGDELRYPCRLFWNLVVPCVIAADYKHYPGVIAFAEGHWPTIVSIESSLTSFVDYKAMEGRGSGSWVFRLVFYPRTFAYDYWGAQASGIRGKRGASLTTILKSHLGVFIRSVEKSKKITDDQRTMVFRQMLDLIEQDRRVLDKKEELPADIKAVYSKATSQFQQALQRVNANISNHSR